MAKRFKADPGKLQPVIEKSKRNGKFFSSLWSANSEQVWKTGDGYENLKDAEDSFALLESPKIQYPIIYVGCKKRT